MRAPVVLPPDQVASEVVRLCGELRQARVESKRSTRDVADEARVQQATLWRIETARHPPTFFRFLSIAAVLETTVDLDDGRGREPVATPTLWLPPDYRPKPPEPLSPEDLADEWKAWLLGAAHRWRVRVGAELWWARLTEFESPLEAEAACRLLEMSHHTMTDVESGPGWPSLTSVIRVAGLSGRRLVLNGAPNSWRSPPWLPPTA